MTISVIGLKSEKKKGFFNNKITDESFIQLIKNDTYLNAIN